MKTKQIAIWGPHADEVGTITCRRNGGFYARFRSRFPSVPGGRKAVYHSRFFRDEDVAAGKVKIVDAK